MEIVRLREREIERKEWQNNGGTHLLPLKSEQSKPKVMHSTLSIDELKDIQGTFMENLFELK